MPPPASRVGFVGLGRMGVPMAGRLVVAGHAVDAYDVSETARRRAAEIGAEPACSLAEVGEAAAVLVLMLPGSDAVEAVIGDRSLLEALAPGTLVIEMSSSEPLRTRELAGRLAERGLRLIDAPVSGGVSGAERGSLTIMVGGEQADLEEARPYLEVLGRVVHAGAIGAGHAVKALNNLLSATHLWITGEAMVAGERFGLDPDVMLSIFNTSSGRSGSTEAKWPNFVRPGSFDSGFLLRLMVKDMAIATGLAEQVGAPGALGRDALGLWAKAAEELSEDADHTEIARFLQAGGRPGAQRSGG